MKLSIGFLIAAMVFAGAAMAQPAADTTNPSVSPSAAPVRPATPAARTLDSVTVVAPLPNRPCSSRDKECIALVVAELKQRYPEQLKRFCFQRTMRTMRSNLLNDTDPMKSPFTAGFSAPPAMQVACAWDKK